GSVTVSELLVGGGALLTVTGCPPSSTLGDCPFRRKPEPVIVSEFGTRLPPPSTCASAPTAGVRAFAWGGIQVTTSSPVESTTAPLTAGGGVGVSSTNETS